MWKKLQYNEYIISEWVVIISKRSEGKQETRAKIIDNTTKLIYENGFVKMSTKEIADESNVSQGSIFLHFQTKNNLLRTILFSNLTNLQNDLEKRCNTNLSQDEFVREFIEILIEHENMLSRSLKDYPYLPDELQKQLDDLETMIKNKFFDNLKSNRSMPINIIDTFVLIDAFTSQIRSYLLERNPQSVTSFLKQRRGRILKLYKMLFQETKV